MSAKPIGKHQHKCEWMVRCVEQSSFGKKLGKRLEIPDFLIQAQKQSESPQGVREKNPQNNLAM